MKAYQDKEVLSNLYEKYKSQKKIAEILQCNHKTIAAWMKKLEISSVGSQGARTHHYNHSYFKDINSEEKAYWLGFIMADGCVYEGSDKSSYRLQINLQARDKNVLEKFQKAIGSSYKISEKTIGKTEVVQLKVNSTEICKDLMKLGVIPRKSIVCEFPILKEELKRHFMRGFFDGDGCITCNKGVKARVAIAGGQYSLNQMKEYFEANGIKSNIYDIKRSRAKSLEVVRKESLCKIYELFYKDATIYLERKHDKFNILMSP